VSKSVKFILDLQRLSRSTGTSGVCLHLRWIHSLTVISSQLLVPVQLTD